VFDLVGKLSAFSSTYRLWTYTVSLFAYYISTSLRTQREEFKVVKQGAETHSQRFLCNMNSQFLRKNVPLKQTVVTFSRLD